MMSDYQIMLWLTYKNFLLKNIDPDLQKQGHSAKPFTIMLNTLPMLGDKHWAPFFGVYVGFCQ